MEPRDEQRLLQLYTDPANPGSYGGVDSLYKASKKAGLTLSRSNVKDVLSKSHTYGMHRNKKERNIYVSRVIATQPFQQWAADLEDLGQKTAKDNDGYRFVLTVIDCFTKKAWVRALKTKSAREVSQAIEEVIKEAGRPPLRLQTDKGSEFLNREAEKIYDKYKIKRFSTENDVLKATIVERLNRTLKNKMHRYMFQKQTRRWVDILDDIVTSYNNSTHSATGKAPNEVTFENANDVVNNLFHGAGRYKEKVPVTVNRKRKFQPGDYVRTTRAKAQFEKGYDATYTEEIFRVWKNVGGSLEKKYYLQDLQGQPIKGAYYEEELQKVKDLPSDYRIRVLRRDKRNKRLFVHWLGWPKSFDSWINERDLTKT